MQTKISLMSDYMEGAHPEVMAGLEATNFESTPGYGEDVYTKEAAEKIKKACQCEQADVYF